MATRFLSHNNFNMFFSSEYNYSTLTIWDEFKSNLHFVKIKNLWNVGG